ncbi:hypothetical protein [Rothia koreensis]|uniref:hypothetical protein n=1 Tax=Rothia koreensis TaxID=592378 RepID=UPI003FCC4065
MATALKKLTSRSIAAISAETALPQTTLNRRAANNTVPIQDLLTICRHYGLNLIDVLHEAGMVTRDEARQMRGMEGLGEYTTMELSEEVYNRELKRTLERQQRSDVTSLSARRRPVTVADVTEEDLMCEAAHPPEEGKAPDRDNYC